MENELIIKSTIREFDFNNKITVSEKNNLDAKKELLAAKNTNKSFEGLCIKCNSNGDLTVDYNGIHCIMLREDISIRNEDAEVVHRGLCNRKVGTLVSFIVKDEKDGDIYISRKELVAEYRKECNKKMVEGSIVRGRVVKIDEERGCFTEIGGDLIGIIPIKNIENLFVTAISDHIEEGEVIRAVVTDITRDSEGNIKTFGLNRKALLPTFEQLTKDLKQGDVILGTVKASNGTGVYCSINKHLDVLCDYPKTVVVKPEDRVKIKIGKLRSDKNRITGTIVAKA